MYNLKKMTNGIQVISEKIPHYRSVSIGLWFKVGSIHEGADQKGISHFIEHMLFKGTEKRSAKDIAQAFDSVGGQLNAFTAKECTCVYSKVIDEHIELAFDVMSDMIFNSLFKESEIEKEKAVILEELSMYEDAPDDVVHELLSSKFFNSHPLGSPILGTRESVENLTKEGIESYFNENYIPHNLVISIAGNFEEKHLDSLLHKYFGNWNKAWHINDKTLTFTPGKGVFYKYKDIEQTHLCIGYLGFPLGSPEVYPLMVFNNIFGGGMSSRLFQTVREEHGLAYSIFSYPSSYVDGGLFTIYAGLKPTQIEEVLSLILGEIDRVKRKDISREEISMAREQLKGSYILGLESSDNRMTSMGKNQLLMGRVLSPDEILSRIDAVSVEDVYGVTEKLLSEKNMTIALVSKDDPSQIIEKIL